MNNEYAAMDHVAWIRSTTGQEPSELGANVIGLLGFIGCGIYNAPMNPRKVDWTNDVYIRVIWQRDLANWDSPHLTALLAESFRRKLRVSIEGVGPRLLALLFHQRTERGTRTTPPYIPHIEGAIRLLDNRGASERAEAHRAVFGDAEEVA